MPPDPKWNVDDTLMNIEIDYNAWRRDWDFWHRFRGINPLYDSSGMFKDRLNIYGQKLAERTVYLFDFCMLTKDQADKATDIAMALEAAGFRVASPKTR